LLFVTTVDDLTDVAEDVGEESEQDVNRLRFDGGTISTGRTDGTGCFCNAL